MAENDLHYQKYLLAEAEQKLMPAKIVLRTVGIIHMVIGTLLLFINTLAGFIAAGVFLTVGIGFIAISLTMNKHPRISVISGLILYCLLILFYSVGGTFSGFFLIFILVISVPIGLWRLITSLRAATEVETLRTIVNNLEGVNVPMDMMH